MTSVWILCALVSVVAMFRKRPKEKSSREELEALKGPWTFVEGYELLYQCRRCGTVYDLGLDCVDAEAEPGLDPFLERVWIADAQDGYKVVKAFATALHPCEPGAWGLADLVGVRRTNPGARELAEDLMAMAQGELEKVGRAKKLEPAEMLRAIGCVAAVNRDALARRIAMELGSYDLARSGQLKGDPEAAFAAAVDLVAGWGDEDDPRGQPRGGELGDFVGLMRFAAMDREAADRTAAEER